MDYITPNYEDLELSTQILIKEALSRDIAVEILDRNDNFLKLEKGEKAEYVKQATRTSVDSYIASLIMENKLITKTILMKQGIRVPIGRTFDEGAQAKAAFKDFTDLDIVIKPKSTNFGVGISIIRGNRSVGDFEQAVEDSFRFDTSVIIEEFIDGKEFRFLIIDYKVVAILHREAANVIGDGWRTIWELVEEKNRSPLRGIGYKTPLEKIKAGSIEESFLILQGKDFGSIPGKGEQVFLRKNSNISTGGDSIDFTDDVAEIYKEIAVKAAKAVGAKICGADIIIRDPMVAPSVTDLEDSYAVIELNFNPAIHIHGFPYQGKNRHAEKHILDLLGF